MIARLFLVIGIVLCMATVLSSSVMAYDPYTGVDCNSSQDTSSTVCTSKSTNNPIAGSDGILIKVARIFAIVTGSAAVVAILVGSLRMIIANGDPAAFAKGRTTVIYSLVGLGVVILGTTIVGFFVSKL